MPYPALAVANYFLDLAEKQGKLISPMKLQKLIYFAHGWHLALGRGPLVIEQVECWDYGPVIPGVYHQFKEFGRGKIEGRAIEFKATDSGGLRMVTPGLDGDSDLTALLDRIWDVYGGMSAIQLSNMSHQSGGAWHQIHFEHGGKDWRGTDIPDDLIKEEFLVKARRAQERRTTA